jgi:hypothetical protein
MDQGKLRAFLVWMNGLIQSAKKLKHRLKHPLNNSISDKFSKKRFMEKRLRPMINGDEVMNTLDLL